MTSTHRNRHRWRRRPGLPLPALLLPALLLLLPAFLNAQGWIEPRPGTPAAWGVQKVSTTVTVRVADRVAHVEVEEWFRNNGPGLGEGDYVYPLPGEAVFASYSLYQGDHELRGELMDAAEARAIYERIVRARRDPALIELVGKGMMRARVFPIETGETRRITLRYTQVLDRAGDALQFRYAAGIRHAGPRQPDLMPMPRMEPAPRGRPRPPEQLNGFAVDRELAPLTFTLVVDDADRFRDAFSPTHALRVERRGGRMTVRPQGDLTGEFTVLLPLAVRVVGLSLLTHRPAGEAGYFMLTLSPDEAAASRIPRDVTVVVDVSGSMSGTKMEQARRALHQLLGALGPDDRVRLIAFSNTVRPWRDTWTRATRGELNAAGQWVDALRADGGTNIHGALETALREKSPDSQLPIVIFMTDGMPTTGETRVDRIVAMAETERGRTRVFVFGVGYDVNTHLLDRLSEAARGTTQYVRPDEDVEHAVSTLATRIRHPVLTDLGLGRAPVRLTDVYPRELPDLFAGEELILFGRYEGSGQGSLEITGRRSGDRERYSAGARFPARADRDEFITRLWASRKLGDLDRRIRAARADGASQRQIDDLTDELRSTALRYGLLSEYTAYLVQEPEIVARADRPQPGAIAAPVTLSGEIAVGRAERARLSREVASVADMEAVQRTASLQMRDDAAQGAAAPEAGGHAAAVRVIAGRRFRMVEGEWRDLGHTTDHRVVTVEPFSIAYFSLLRALPELGLVLRELESGVVAGERVSIRVGGQGARHLADDELRRVVAEFRRRR
jgi:Ca-activated chloride channel homolog